MIPEHIVIVAILGIALLWVMSRDLKVDFGGIAVLLPIALVLTIVAGFAIAAGILIGTPR